MLTQEELPESLTGPCLDVLREVLPERELIRIVVEVIHELRDRPNTAEGTTSSSTVCRHTFSCPVCCLPTLPRLATAGRQNSIRFDSEYHTTRWDLAVHEKT